MSQQWLKLQRTANSRALLGGPDPTTRLYRYLFRTAHVSILLGKGECRDLYQLEGA